MKKLIYLFLALIIVACSDDSSSDITAPIITLNGQAIATINLNSTYTDAGATATDDVDGDLTSSIVTTGVVNTSIEGNYIITYTVSDTSGNTATATRQVIVEENLAIGDSYQGGIIAYIDSTGQHGLIAATADHNGSLTWFPAMSYCAALKVTVDGSIYYDWYLPNLSELYQLYLNKAAIGGFTDYFYWSSTEYDNNGAWRRSFISGQAYTGNQQVDTYNVRAVRAF